MAYNEKILDHYENPRNVGTLDKNSPDVGTGLVGAPACGDVMRLQIEVCDGISYETEIGNKYVLPLGDLSVSVGGLHDFGSGLEKITAVQDVGKIIHNAKFKTFGCGSAIASSSLVTEWVKGKTLGYAQTITNREIVEALSLPPVKVHCSVLAEDAIKAAVNDYVKKQAAQKLLLDYSPLEKKVEGM